MQIHFHSLRNTLAKDAVALVFTHREMQMSDGYPNTVVAGVPYPRNLGLIHLAIRLEQLI